MDGEHHEPRPRRAWTFQLLLLAPGWGRRTATPPRSRNPEDKGRYLLVGERVLSHPVGSLGGGTEGRPWASCKRPERRVCPLSSSATALRFVAGRGLGSAT